MFKFTEDIVCYNIKEFKIFENFLIDKGWIPKDKDYPINFPVILYNEEKFTKHKKNFNFIYHTSIPNEIKIYTKRILRDIKLNKINND